MSNFICSECGKNIIDCGHGNLRTDRELELEIALNAILTNGPACQYDKDCPLSNGGRGDKILSSVFMGQVPAIQTYAIMSNSWRIESKTPE